MTEHNPREAQAEREIGHTVIRPVAARLFVAFFLLALALPLLWESLHHATDTEPGAFHPLTETFHILPGVKSIRGALGERGSVGGIAELNRQTLERMERVEDRLRETSPLRDDIILPANQLLSEFLGGSNAEVYPGQDGWLFYGPAVRHVTGPAFPPFAVVENDARYRDPVAALRAFHADLAAQGISLIVLPVPSKVSLYPERLNPWMNDTPTPRNVAWEDFVNTLSAAGIAVCDVVPTLRDAKARSAAYLRRDTHWTPDAMARCAELLADSIEKTVALPAEEGKAYVLGEAYTTSSAGDLAAMLYPGAPATHGGEDEVSLRPVLDESVKAWEPDPGADVLLLGDSFTNIYSRDDLGWGQGAGLAEQLSFCLQRPVDRIARNDNGAFASRQALSESLARGDDRLANTRVVVYEFAARELSFGDWKQHLPLRLGSRDSAPSTLSDATTIRARILDRSLPPTPGSAPYKDCLVSLLLEPEADQGSFTGPLLIYAWGMRDHQWTGVTGWQEGDTVEVRLSPWETVARDLESIKHVPLDREDHAGLVPWWLDVVPPPGTVQPPPIEIPVTSPTLTPPDSLTGLVAQLEGNGQPVYTGSDGWLFLTSELRSLSVGTFWGEAAPAVSQARNTLFADPLPAILDFHQQLKRGGIELILMPVPPKAGIYTEELPDHTVRSDVELAMSAQGAVNTFIARLREAGVTVIDLAEVFRARRTGATDPLYCRTDSHWSPEGLMIASEQAATAIQAQSWYRDLPTSNYATQGLNFTMKGDLASLLGDNTPMETLPLTRVGEIERGIFTPLTSNRESPVVLLGDSHNLVFHAGGDMHATAAGLPDLLALALGFPVDLVAVRGSGATAPRITLARRQDQLAGKKMILWCFSTREFTESTTGWRPVSIVP